MATPDELRRLARQREADAARLAADADRLCVQAAALDGILDPLVPMSQRVWTGPAAQDFESRVHAHAQTLSAQARRLRWVAAELDRRARQDLQAAGELRSQAVAMQTAASTGAAVPGVV